MNPLNRLAQLDRSIVTVIDFGPDSGRREHSPGRTIVRVEAGVTQDQIEVEPADKIGWLHVERLL